VIARLLDWASPTSGLPAHTLEAALVPCCDLRCKPGSTCATDHHGPERDRYNRRIAGTVMPYDLDEAEREIRDRLRGAA